LRHDFAAVRAGARPEVYDLIGAPDGGLVMLDNDHGISDVAQAAERFEQPPVVALMQADGWFVENVADPDQPASHLRGQADALRLAAGQRSAGTVERQVADAYVHHELQPLVDFLQHRLADALHFPGEGQRFEER